MKKNSNKTKLAICVYIVSSNDIAPKKDELSLLADTANYTIFSTVEYKQLKINSGTYISKGHLEDLVLMIEENDIEYIIFDNELSASQISNIERITSLGIRTRTEIILEIFKYNAKTRIAKLQVDLAMLEFEYPRLKGKWSHLSRTAAGIGIRGGPGETQLEYDRRTVRERISKMKKELSRLDKSVENSMKNRKDAFRISLVGYTNAGKSSLFNLLCQSDSYVENKLFATLDTKTRKLYLDDNMGMDIILSDTVGFIDRLPHSLVASFKSTLYEVSAAQLILHLIDSNDSDIEKIMNSVETVLDEINASNIKRIIVFNKVDIISEERFNLLKTRFEDAIFISVHQKQNIDFLKNKLLDIILLYDM